MKKIIIVLALSLAMVTSVYAEDYSRTVTGNLMNGYAFDEGTDAANFTITYTLGIIDALFMLQPNRMNRFYPNCRVGDIVDTVKMYYRDHPTKKYRSIYEVVLRGCK